MKLRICSGFRWTAYYDCFILLDLRNLCLKILEILSFLWLTIFVVLIFWFGLYLEAIISFSSSNTQFINPEFQFPQFRVLQWFFFSFWNKELYWHFWVYIDINLKKNLKKYWKRKQTKYLGFVKLGVWWAEKILEKLRFFLRF